MNAPVITKHLYQCHYRALFSTFIITVLVRLHYVRHASCKLPN